MFNRIIQTVLVAFLMKMSGLCTGMFFLKIMLSNFQKLPKSQKHVHHVHHSSRARGTVLFLQTSPSLTRHMNVKVAVELYYIFSKILKF